MHSEFVHIYHRRMVVLTKTEFDQIRELLMKIDDGSITTTGCRENVLGKCLQLKSDTEGAAKIIDTISKQGTNWIASSPGKSLPFKKEK